MNLTLLDNPIWQALNSYHRDLAIFGKIAACYQPEIFLFRACPKTTVPGLMT